MALVLQFTSITNPLLDQLATVLAFVILFIAAFIAGLKAKSKGWLVGILLSLGFSLFVFLFQYLGYGELFSVKQIIFHTGFLAACIIGAILGVNLTGNRQRPA